MGVAYVIRGAGDGRYIYAIEPQDAINHGLPVSLYLRFIKSSVPFVDVSSCDGALCFNSFDGRIAICNLVNNRLKFLPLTQLHRPSAPIHFENCAFGYDSTSQDYKVVRFFTRTFEENEEYLGSEIKSEVFSFENNSWKEIPAPPFPFMLCPTRGCAVVNDTCHWLASLSDSFQILAFNFADETFSAFPLPSTYDGDTICHVVTTANGLLGVILSSRNGVSKCFQLWERRDEWARLYDDVIIENVKKPVNLDSSMMYLVRETTAGLHQLLAYDWADKQLSVFDIYENRHALKMAFCVPSPTPWLRQSKTLDCYPDKAGWNHYWRRIERKVEGED